MRLNTTILIFALVLSSCGGKNPQTANVPPGPDSALTKISIGLLDVAKSTSALQTSVINANKANLLSDKNTGTILAICSRVNIFVGQASQITRSQVVLAPAQRSNLLDLLNPILGAFESDMQAGLLGITDEKTKTTVSAALLAIETAISGIKLALGS